MKIIDTVLMERLNKWYEKMRDLDQDGVHSARILAQQEIKEIKRSKTVYIFYTLLLFRNQIFCKENISDEIIEKLNSFSVDMEDYHKFYFKYFMGLYEYGQRRFENAVNNYITAEDNLFAIHDSVEKAEFYYKVGSAYYHNENYKTSVLYALKALNCCKKNNGNQKRLADCKVLLGQSYTELKDFQKATSCFNEALIEYQKINDQNLLYILYHNLGILYAKRGISKKAIENYNLCLEISKSDELKIPTLYLLSKELLKKGEIESGKTELNRAFEMANESNDVEYYHHLKILQAEYISSYNLESVLEEAITFFKENGLWEGVNEYAKKIGDLLFKQSQFEKAAIYYKLITDKN